MHLTDLLRQQRRNAPYHTPSRSLKLISPAQPTNTTPSFPIAPLINISRTIILPIRRRRLRNPTISSRRRRSIIPLIRPRRWRIHSLRSWRSPTTTPARRRCRSSRRSRSIIRRRRRGRIRTGSRRIHGRRGRSRHVCTRSRSIVRIGAPVVSRWCILPAVVVVGSVLLRLVRGCFRAPGVVAAVCGGFGASCKSV
jgi:hypothetical protein